MAATKAAVLGLYKAMLRESSKFVDYNFRSYALRKVRDEFRNGAAIKDAGKLRERMEFAESNLAMIKRQVIVGQLYSSGETLTIEANRAK